MTSERKLVPRGSVASIIKNLHKLEYESGRLPTLAQPKSRSTLAEDHPAQRPKGDRPVPFHEKPVLRLHTPEPEKEIDHEAFRFEVPDLKHYKESVEEDRERERENPFKRRDSLGSCVSTPPERKRESISHRAFQRVRTASFSPSPTPPLAMPVPRVEVSPWHESAEHYIQRKLTERWSPASRSGSILHASHDRSAGYATGSSHVDAPLVQDILGHIDKILMEHTGTLRDVIDDSRRVLREKEMLCPEQGEDDWRSETSTVPELIRAVDDTAKELGISLSEQHLRYPELAVVGRETNLRALSPVSPRHKSPSLEHEVEYRYKSPSREHEREIQHSSSHQHSRHQRHRRRSSSSEKAHRVLGLSPSHSGTSSPKANRLLGLPTNLTYTHQLPSIPSQDTILHHKLSSQSNSTHERSGYNREGPSANLWHRKTSHPDHWHGPHSQHYHHNHHEPLAREYKPNKAILPHNHYQSSSSSSSSPEIIDTTQRAILSPSPAFVEYDRFAALADRASRNSLNDIVDQIAIAAATPDLEDISRKMGDQTHVRTTSLNEVLESFPPPPEQSTQPRKIRGGGSNTLEQQPPTEDPKKVIRGGSKARQMEETWQARNEAARREKGKLKRTTTVDKLRDNGEGTVVKRVKQAREPVGIAKTGKRATQGMVDSIMTRQGRDGERRDGWKN